MVSQTSREVAGSAAKPLNSQGPSLKMKHLFGLTSFSRSALWGRGYEPRSEGESGPGPAKPPVLSTEHTAREWPETRQSSGGGRRAGLPWSTEGRFMWFAHPSTQSTSQEWLKASLDESAGRHHPHWSALRMATWRAAAEPRDLLARPVHGGPSTEAHPRRPDHGGLSTGSAPAAASGQKG